MKIVLIIVLIPLAALLLLCAGIAVYALILMIRRPPRALYEARTKEADFVALSDIPERMTGLFLELEDRIFHIHHGFVPRVIPAVIKLNFKAKKTIYGGSTITQQLAKNLYFRFNQSYIRKAAELLIAITLERTLGKDRILELYLNVIYFGNGTYGISEASRFYFNKPPSDLTINQMFMLACLPAIPTRGNPIQYPEVFERVRNKRLSRMKPPLLSPDEAALIFSYHADRLDPELREPDEFTRNYPRDIPQINERYGPFARKTKA